ncbi:hypothetical protein [Kutzneria buriramensis]|uniref:Uncharacterized protein n=1 Tax=Kutzneria buriramensis TaxID=1045776 RepID=A0A3E0GUG4_9PSEU|nr:hypothetical protein [Kutzneria buriramensis]REH28572.1 hypothetical protein BCF44_12614 [Kutzneria buriramensis]
MKRWVVTAVAVALLGSACTGPIDAALSDHTPVAAVDMTVPPGVKDILTDARQRVAEGLNNAAGFSPLPGDRELSAGAALSRTSRPT